MQICLAIEQEKEKWNQFVRDNETGSFAQAWEWADFLNTQKEKIWRFVVEQDGDWLAVCFLFKQKMQMNQNVLYCPRGPVMTNLRTDVVRLIIQEIDKIAKQENALTFEIDPLSEDKNWQQIFDNLDFEKTELNMQPMHTLILDLRVEQDELLKNMHQKTRYNINLAKKRGVEVLVDNIQFKEFYELLKKTQQRQKVQFFSQEYFKGLLQVPFVKLYLAKFENKIIAANIMAFWDNTATYLFGASDYDYRQVMAPHLLQWQAIQDAKQEGLWFYDFWGAAPKDSKGQEEKWFGFTKFKMGFSPDAEITEYVGTYEKIYQPVKMGLYRYMRKIFK